MTEEFSLGQCFQSFHFFWRIGLYEIETGSYQYFFHLIRRCFRRNRTAAENKRDN
jgi:hypothetical protein